MKRIIYLLLLMISLVFVSCTEEISTYDGTYNGTLSGTGIHGKFRITISQDAISGYVQTNVHSTFQVTGQNTDGFVRFNQVGTIPEIEFIGIITLPKDINGRFDVGSIAGTFEGKK